MAAVATPSVFIAKYSDKAGVVFGDGTRELKDKLKAAKCRFNPKLTINGAQTAGWIFPLANRAAVAAAIGLGPDAALAVKKESASAPDVSAEEADPVGHDGDNGGTPAAAVAEETAVGPSAVPAQPAAMRYFSAPDSSFLVVGPTFRHRAALKAAGGEWVSGWLFPGAAREAVDAVLAGPADAAEPPTKGAAPKVAGRKRARGAKGGRSRAGDADA